MHPPQPSAVTAAACCILCGGNAGQIRTADGALYFKCEECALIHLDPARRLSEAAELARYQLHENDPNDPEYVRFLRRLADVVAARLPAGAVGLDFGCGPAPVLSGILADAGFPCEAYDPFFATDESLLKQRYQYITCCEVVEHLHDPARTFEVLRELLAPGGLLGVMTRFYASSEAFDDWWYRRDPTHVCFYNETTMDWIARRHGMSVEFPRPDVAVFIAP